MNKEIFQIEHQYQLFLQRMALNEDNMHPQQKKQLKETFYGATGQMIILFRDDIAALPEDKAVEIFQDILNQVGDFFLTKKGEQN